MTNYMIRAVQLNDAAELLAMIRELTAFHDDTGEITMDDVIRDAFGASPWWHAFVAEADGALIGYMILLPKSKIADGKRGIDLNHLYIRDAYRGTGVGRALIEQAIKFARVHACRYILIGTAPGNTAAQAAYLACGFEDFPDSGGPRFRMEIG